MRGPDLLATVDWGAIASAIGVAVALALGLVNLVRERRRSRHEELVSMQADVRVRLESYPLWQFERWDRDMRIVIENRGFGTARSVDVEVTNAKDRSPIRDEGLLPVPELYGGSEVHLHVVLLVGGPYPLDVKLTWSDGSGQRERRVLLTLQHRF